MLLNLHQKLPTMFVFSWALQEAWRMETNWMLFISESTLQNTPVVAQRSEFGKHTREWGASGHRHTREASLVSNSWNIPTCGHSPCLTPEPLVLHLNHLLVQDLKQTENCARCTLRCPTEIFLKVVQGLTDRAIRCLWDSSVSHLKPRGLCFSGTVLSLTSKMDSGTSPNKVWVTEPKRFTRSDAKNWIWPARWLFLVPTSAGQTNY